MCANALLVPRLAVAALVLLVAARTFQTCAAHPRLLVATDDESGKLEAEAGGARGAEHYAGETKHHPDYTVAIARNPFSTARAGVQLPQQGVPSFADDDLQLNREIGQGDRTKRQTEQRGGTAVEGDVVGNAKDGSAAWEEPLAEASRSDVAATDASSSESSEDDAAAEAISSVIYGQRIVPRIEPPAQEQHFFPSFASLFSPPPPPPLGYNHDSSINRPRHHSGQLPVGVGERNHFGHHHHHHSPYSGFEGYGDDEDDTFGLFQGSEHGTHSPRPPPPVLQPPRTKPSYQVARQQSASVSTDAKHSGILGSGNFAVVRGGTFYDDKDKSASEHRGSYYGDPFGNGHGGPSYNSGGYHRGLPSNPRPRPGRDHFADFRDFADITAPKPAFSQLVVVYAANQNGSGGEEGRNGSGSGQNTPPRNIIERLRLLDGEEGDKDETESQRNAQGMGDDMVLWDGEGGREDEEEEVVGDDRGEEEEEEEGNIQIIVRPNNINDKLKLLDAEPESMTEEIPKKEKPLSQGKRKLALIREKGKWVSDKAKRISKEVEPLLALS